MKKDPPEFQVGIMPDLAMENAPIVRFAENAVFEPTGIRPTEGQLLTVLPVAGNNEVLGLLSQQIDGEDYITWGDKNNIYSKKWEIGGVAVPGTGYALNPLRDFWSIVSWGTWTLAANGLERIQLRKGIADTFDDVEGGSMPVVRLLCRRSPFLLAFYQASYQWCDVDDVETWTAAPENLAGDNVLRDIDSEITAVCEWNGEVAVATRNSLHYISFVPGNDVFSQRKLLSNIGAVGPMALCTAKGMLFGYSERGFWQSDGVSYNYIDTPGVKETMNDRINEEYRHRVCVTPDRQNEKILIFLPPDPAVQNQECWAWSLRYNNWSFAKFGRTCGDPGDVLAGQVFGGADGALYEQTQRPIAPTAATAQSNYLIPQSSVQLRIGYGRGRYGRMPYGGLIIGS